jgi:hypothetical protein
MTATRSDLLYELLAQSVVAWGIVAEARHASGGAIRICGEHREILVNPAPPGLPFRWLVTLDHRERPAISIVAVLRQVREALDPGYTTRRVRIAAFPLVPT